MSYSEISDNELIYLIRSDNKEALDFFIERYKKRIYGIIYGFKKKMGIKSLDYDDWYGMCVIILLKCIDGFDEQYNFYSYLSRAINNQMFKRFNNEKEELDVISLQEYAFVENECLDVVSEPKVLYEQEELKDYVRDNFSKIDRQIIEYRLEGYKVVEIASILGITVKATYKRLEKIRFKMLTKV